MVLKGIPLLFLAVLLLAAFLPLFSSPATARPKPALLQSGPTALSATGVPSYFNSNTTEATAKVRVVLVKSILTSTAYSNELYPGVDSFYIFYNKYRSTPTGDAVHKNLNWLTTPLSAGLAFHNGWGEAYPIYRFMGSDLAQRYGLRTFSKIDDVQVDGGGLFFANGSRRFDVAVMGKSEYVTAKELSQYAQFVRSGGRLVLMDSDNFEVQVKLESCPNLCETFANGHGWTFSGAMVHSGVWNAFPSIDKKLTGSLLPEKYYVGPSIGTGQVHPRNVLGSKVYQLFGPTVLSDYKAHEESRLVNKTNTDVIISFNFEISSYIHRYGLGDVVCFCLEGSRIIEKHQVAQYFLMLAISTWGEPRSRELETTVPLTAAQGAHTARIRTMSNDNFWYGSQILAQRPVSIRDPGESCRQNPNRGNWTTSPSFTLEIAPST